MATYKCLVHGSLPDDLRRRFTDELIRITDERFGIDRADVMVEYTEIAEGRWFTAGEPSEAAMVLGTVPPGTAQDARVAAMDEIARCYSAVTGTEYDDVMVVAADPKPGST